MAKEIKVPALILKINNIGENHRGITMLTESEGLLRPVAFGARSRRSTLKGTAIPFNEGIASLHYSGDKNAWRLTAFDPVDIHTGFNSNLEKFYTASGWAEVLLGLHGGGTDPQFLFRLSAEAFSLLSVSSEKEITRVNLIYLWRLLELEGVMPDLSFCSSCGMHFGSSVQDIQRKYTGSGALLCRKCSAGRGVVLSEGAVKWLMYNRDKSLREALETGLAANAAESAIDWLILLIQNLLERPVKSFKYYGERYGKR